MRESLDSNLTNRLLVGSILLILIITSYYLNLELILISIMIFFITYDFYNIKVFRSFHLIILTLLPFVSLLFFTNQIIQLVIMFLCIVILLILVTERFKKELFLLSVYLFCILLFYLASNERNLFYTIIFISFFNDTIAYIFGKAIGGPLILPKISPRKTWAGTSISFFLSTLTLVYLSFSIYLSALVSIFLFLGDIFFSYIKRYLKLNDFSLLLKSHGGILDRLDSMFFITIILSIYKII